MTKTKYTEEDRVSDEKERDFLELNLRHLNARGINEEKLQEEIRTERNVLEAVAYEQRRYIKLLKRVIGGKIQDDFSYTSKIFTEEDKNELSGLALYREEELNLVDLYKKTALDIKRTNAEIKKKKDEFDESRRFAQELYREIKYTKDKLEELIIKVNKENNKEFDTYKS